MADSQASGRGRGGGRHNSGRGHSHGCSFSSQPKKRTVVNGVDCTNLTRWYSKDKIFTLPADIQNSIKDAKAQRKRTHSSASNASNAPTTAQRIVSSIQTILSGSNKPVDDISAPPLDAGATTDPNDQPGDSAAGTTPGDAFK